MSILDFGADDPTGGATYENFPSFMGGLMGGQGTGYDTAGTALGALGHSLMFSPSNAPLKGFQSAISQANSTGADDQKQAIIQALKRMGLSDEQATALATSPGAAQAMAGGQLGGMSAMPFSLSPTVTFPSIGGGFDP